jgi:hypothetical protein
VTAKPLIFNARVDGDPAEVRFTRHADGTVEVRITAAETDTTAVVHGSEWDRAALPTATAVAAYIARHGIPGTAKPDTLVDAVLDVISPWADTLPGIPRSRFPVIRLELDGRMITPDDATCRSIAEQIVTRIRAAAG